jgi:hypothetical protein
MDKIGYIYALYYDGLPFYIGQTKRSIWQRYKDHRVNTFNGNNLHLYVYMRSLVTDWDEFQTTIYIKKIKEASLCELNDLEKKYISVCLDNNIKLYNMVYN